MGIDASISNIAESMFAALVCHSSKSELARGDAEQQSIQHDKFTYHDKHSRPNAETHMSRHLIVTYYCHSVAEVVVELGAGRYNQCSLLLSCSASAPCFHRLTMYECSRTSLEVVLPRDLIFM